MHPASLKKLYEFVRQGGRLFCIEQLPHLSLGWNHHEEEDRQVCQWIERLKEFPDRFVLLDKPADNNFMDWYAQVQKQYGLTPYLTFSNPDPFLLQNRYCSDRDEEIFLIVNSKLYEPHRTRINFAKEITRGRWPWIWNPLTGERFRVELDRDGGMELDLGPTELLLIVFDRNRKGPQWQPLPLTGEPLVNIEDWDVELHHARESWTRKVRMQQLQDLRNTEFVNFAGEVIYRTNFVVDRPAQHPVLNLGRVAGIAEVTLNGEPCGVRWCGRRLYDLTGKLRERENRLEVKVTTTLGNYMRTLTDNETAQKWVGGRKTQPEQSMGLIGPVSLYESDRVVSLSL